METILKCVVIFITTHFLCLIEKTRTETETNETKKRTKRRNGNETKKVTNMTIKQQQRRIIKLLRTIADSANWNQRVWADDSTHCTKEKPCGTSCCVAGHITNLYPDQYAKSSYTVPKFAAEKIKHLFQLSGEYHVKDSQEGGKWLIGHHILPFHTSATKEDFVSFADKLELIANKIETGTKTNEGSK